MIQKMEKHQGEFVSIVDDDTTVLEKVMANPKQVVILIDGKCASSTEQFLLAAVQSRKVTLMGQSTRGVLDYANMRDVAYPCFPFTLSYATTRSRRLNTGKGVDLIGIRPNVFLQTNEDWITRAIQYLRTKRYY
jgi:C-terminal processing protease CtpA/Prc